MNFDLCERALIPRYLGHVADPRGGIRCLLSMKTHK
jgi:hypothetical protein